MKKDFSRRDFTKLSLAALGGALGGSLLASCKQADKARQAGSPNAELLLQEPHVCRGLNSCQGKGATGNNACAGQGKCATAEHHSCAGQNACKGQGGCGEHPGQNACKDQGSCAVPLSDKAWENARADFEQAMNEAGKRVGEAPTA